VVVVHGGVVGQAVAMATGGRAFAFTGADYGSITHLVAEPAGWVLRRFDDTAHLGAGLDLVPEPPAG
jgi:probable phosphoglycerate mutase